MQPEFNPHTPRLALAALAAVATIASAAFVDRLASGPGPFQIAARTPAAPTNAEVVTVTVQPPAPVHTAAAPAPAPDRAAQ